MYIQPQNVHAPADWWKLKEVLINQGETNVTPPPEKWALAMGYWLGEPCCALRLNGGQNKPRGYPTSYREPIWMILPTELNRAMMALPQRPPAEKAKAVAFLPIGSNVVCWPPSKVKGGPSVAANTIAPVQSRCRIVGDSLLNQGPSSNGKNNPAKFSLVLGFWWDEHRILLRWNGIPDTEHAKGRPLAGAHASWFPLPRELDVSVMPVLSAEQARKCGEWLRSG